MRLREFSGERSWWEPFETSTLELERNDPLANQIRHFAAVIRGVRVAPSPAWLATRLAAVGQRSINNVVDATNYVLFELNQPLHAFDLAKLRGPALVIRRATANFFRTFGWEGRRNRPFYLQRPAAAYGRGYSNETNLYDAPWWYSL